MAVSPSLWPATAAAWNGKVFPVDLGTVDRYGGIVVFVRVGDTVVNEELIRQGLPRLLARYRERPICEQWGRLETEARKPKRGLWSMPKLVAPWGSSGGGPNNMGAETTQSSVASLFACLIRLKI